MTPEPPRTTLVEFSELLLAFDFVSACAPSENRAYICTETGKIYGVSDVIDSDEDVPEDVETAKQYIPIPHKLDLDLGRSLALSFTEEQLPGDWDTVVGIFRSRGAYRKFKQILVERNALKNWYDFDQAATEEALREWCQESHIRLNGT